MPRFQDLTGKRYGKLVAVKYIGRDQNSKSIWELKCDCGNTTTGTTKNLNYGHKNSCGCGRAMEKSDYIDKVKKALLEKRKIVGECWEWQGQVDHRGYGRRTFGQRDQKRKTLVHRISFAVFKGPIPEEKCICHTCDNRLCFNPDHLWVGTLQDNLKDMKDKGRHAIGKMLPQTKLDERKVIEIRRRYTDGEKVSSIAKDYGTTYQPIYNVCIGKTWRHVL